MTAGKVRAALIEEAGAADVYFEEQIEILVSDPEQFSADAAKRVLAENKVEYSTMAESETR